MADAIYQDVHQEIPLHGIIMEVMRGIVKDVLKCLMPILLIKGMPSTYSDMICVHPKHLTNLINQ
jgi:hypothetical protein